MSSSTTTTKHAGQKRGRATSKKNKAAGRSKKRARTESTESPVIHVAIYSNLPSEQFVLSLLCLEADKNKYLQAAMKIIGLYQEELSPHCSDKPLNQILNEQLEELKKAGLLLSSSSSEAKTKETVQVLESEEPSMNLAHILMALQRQSKKSGLDGFDIEPLHRFNRRGKFLQGDTLILMRSWSSFF